MVEGDGGVEVVRKRMVEMVGFDWLRGEYQ